MLGALKETKFVGEHSKAVHINEQAALDAFMSTQRADSPVIPVSVLGIRSETVEAVFEKSPEINHNHNNSDLNQEQDANNEQDESVIPESEPGKNTNNLIEEKDETKQEDIPQDQMDVDYEMDHEDIFSVTSWPEACANMILRGVDLGFNLYR